MSEPALIVDGLVKRYGATVAVDGLSLTALGGAVTALLGPNGAGKTTTVEICEGYRRPDSGAVRVLGHDPSDHRLRPRVGVMLQSGGVYPGARAGEMLRLVASYAAHPLDVDDLLDVVGLQSVARTTFRRLSGGEKQRLSLAMAIVGRPELVFLDEPTAGLDPQARRSAWSLVEDLRAAGVAVLLTTHYLEEAEHLADHVVIIDHGHVVASGTPSELTAKSTGGLQFRAIPGVDVNDLATTVHAPVIEVSPGFYVVQAPPDPQLLAAVTAWCAKHGILAEDLHVVRRSLEDVFLELTGDSA
ncbi:MAG: type transport system ATP-binding protein [Frankiales bacterium]|nr:type transport system ATP-binding protein [Frankiales bacterium]